MIRKLLQKLRQSFGPRPQASRAAVATQAPETPALPTTLARNLDEYRDFFLSMQQTYAERDAAEVALVGPEEPFETTGWCYVCNKASVFMSDLL